MILNQRTLIFLLIVFLIIITLFHNKFSINKNNKNLLLLAIILSIFIFYNKFVNPRVEDFIENKLTDTENFDAAEQTPENTTPTPLRRLYLNKSPYHRSFTVTTPVTRMTTSNSENTEQENKEEKIGENELNLYSDADILNTAETTIKNGNPLENLLKFNYLSTDDMIKNIGKRHYNFPIVNLNFNQDENAVTTNDEATPTDISSIIYTTDNKNNKDTSSNEDNGDTSSNDDNEDTSSNDDNEDNTPVRRRTAIVSEQTEQRDGLSAFINNFFSSIQSIFE